MSTAVLSEILGWCIVLNVGVMLVQFVIVTSLRERVSRLHVRMFDLEEAAVRRAYFQYFSHYKIALIVLNVVPYVALKIVG